MPRSDQARYRSCTAAGGARSDSTGPGVWSDRAHPAATTSFASSQSALSGGDAHRAEAFAPHTLSPGRRCRTRRAGVSRFAPRGGGVSRPGCATVWRRSYSVAEPRSRTCESLWSGHWRLQGLKVWSPPKHTEMQDSCRRSLNRAAGATARRATGSNLGELSGLHQQRLPWLDGKRLSPFGHGGRHLGERFGIETGIPLAAS